MSAAYYDSTYLFKAMAGEPDSPGVQAHAATLGELVCCQHGRVEFASICHRKTREGTSSEAQRRALMAQLGKDTAAGRIRWLPLNGVVLDRAVAAYETAPATVFLRAADALHLACAAGNGFAEVYSNDRHFLAAAPLFGLRGVNVIPSL